jgi:hypothetical protein
MGFRGREFGKKNKAALKISVLPYLSEYTTLFAELSALKLK